MVPMMTRQPEQVETTNQPRPSSSFPSSNDICSDRTTIRSTSSTRPSSTDSLTMRAASSPTLSASTPSGSASMVASPPFALRSASTAAREVWRSSGAMLLVAQAVPGVLVAPLPARPRAEMLGSRSFPTSSRASRTWSSCRFVPLGMTRRSIAWCGMSWRRFATPGANPGTTRATVAGRLPSCLPSTPIFASRMPRLVEAWHHRRRRALLRL
mmetsp:Transcript_24357/g.53153  ORF Transcript_24357/g.53153 Transcript_24357/m.53153 type:complete len:212 (-) Transcript_24357:45-680(-)